MKFLFYIFIISILLLQTGSALPTDEGPLVITVKEKWTKMVGSGEDLRGLYLFSDMNGNVYSIEDTFWHFDFSAADRFAKIQPNMTYKMWFFGWRIPYMSMYQNAYRIEEIN